MRILDFTRKIDSKEEKMKAYNLAYRLNHNKVINCPCGGVFKEISKYTHNKSRIHLDYVSALKQ